MKTPFNKRMAFAHLIRLGLISIYAAILSTACNKPDLKSFMLIDSTRQFIAPDRNRQLVIWVNPGTTDEALAKYLRDLEDKTHGKVYISSVCSHCDSNLMMLTGPGIDVFISGQTTPGGNTCTNNRCGPSGDDGPVTYSINYEMEFSDSSLGSTEFEYPVENPFLQSGAKKEVSVAVFDTGIDPKAISFNSYKGSNECCLGLLAARGWNFVANNNAWYDDNAKRHGTTVTNFIMQQAIKFRSGNVRILPVKIHDSLGRAGLFDILCAFAYASNQKVNLINASFGYYAAKATIPGTDPDSCSILLKKYVKHYITDKGILLVAAAGNRSVYEDTAKAFSGLSADDKRNLDKVAFYPASLGENAAMSNVIAVTTVSTFKGVVCPLQNQSPHVVDLGVNADNVSGNFFTFVKPFVGGSPEPSVLGSSFATPIATGILAANYFSIPEISSANKNSFLPHLPDLGLATANSGFDGQIRHGMIMNK